VGTSQLRGFRCKIAFLLRIGKQWVQLVVACMDISPAASPFDWPRLPPASALVRRAVERAARPKKKTSCVASNLASGTCGSSSRSPYT